MAGTYITARFHVQDFISCVKQPLSSDKANDAKIFTGARSIALRERDRGL
jgi:hypothetical protein